MKIIKQIKETVEIAHVHELEDSVLLKWQSSPN